MDPNEDDPSLGDAIEEPKRKRLVRRKIGARPVTNTIPHDGRIKDDRVTKERQTCISSLNGLLRYDPFVRQMLKAIENAGCAIPGNFFLCRTCPLPMGAFFEPGIGVVACENFPTKKTTFRNIVIHELVHAWDFCTRETHGDKDDEDYCYKLACQEVHAINMSSECNWSEELRRRFIGPGQGFKCVRRRAIVNVAAEPKCTRLAEDYVDFVFDSCAHDIEPLGYFPW